MERRTAPGTGRDDRGSAGRERGRDIELDSNIVRSATRSRASLAGAASAIALLKLTMESRPRGEAGGVSATLAGGLLLPVDQASSSLRLAGFTPIRASRPCRAPARSFLPGLTGCGSWRGSGRNG